MIGVEKTGYRLSGMKHEMQMRMRMVEKGDARLRWSRRGSDLEVGVGVLRAWLSLFSGNSCF